MKILLVEDEESIRGFLRINFQRENFQVIECESGEEGVRKALIEKPDIAILDVMLPGMNGFEVCQKLRESFPRMGIIMLTAKGEDMDKIMGLQFGADDYVLKPFNPLEITLRVKALIRRLEGISEENNSDCIEVDNFKLDLYSQSLYKENIEIDVTPKEFLLMKIFMQNPGKAFTRDELLNLVWGIDFFGDPKIVDVNIRRLRSKIEDNSSKPKYIETVWGTGYRWKR
ncbi:response regulator transcription factor [Clostridium perfringens]|uniref:Stage 0 sporulation protein A homolog n=1 Tax=Clostridium perfringens TaxID=1502 RepID=A0A133N773_CLOPF|nr:response regulator transcription factor [Clostridium perfringens]EGT3601624.1 response regulator transcription factor [Clostridium perfringens]EGT5619817.1 response regulator transcription factor [Clostridium perfringens]EHK2440004.1 response regulator transcription factor [Clostridium perfringens]KXA12118.1 putative alkaline phosphatase synthesis transcriptional regulatory protein PhoP [Clostridium perfringens]MBS5922296.1 response regulator transcription factor [Clostridium perfringens]